MIAVETLEVTREAYEVEPDEPVEYADIKAATLQDLADAEPAANEDADKINYDNLTVEQDETNVTITGKVTKEVVNGDYVAGFGNINIPDEGIESD